MGHPTYLLQGFNVFQKNDRYQTQGEKSQISISDDFLPLRPFASSAVNPVISSLRSAIHLRNLQEWISHGDTKARRCMDREKMSNQTEVLPCLTRVAHVGLQHGFTRGKMETPFAIVIIRRRERSTNEIQCSAAKSCELQSVAGPQINPVL